MQFDERFDPVSAMFMGRRGEHESNRDKESSDRASVVRPGSRAIFPERCDYRGDVGKSTFPLREQQNAEGFRAWRHRARLHSFERRGRLRQPRCLHALPEAASASRGVGCSVDGLEQLRPADRFDEVDVEAGGAAALVIFGPPVACERD